MKKLLLLLCTLCLCACSSHDTNLDKLKKKYFSNVDIPLIKEEVLDYPTLLKMDTKGMKKEIKENKEDATKDIYYKKNNHTVYIKHVGYGENTIDHFPENNVKITYLDKHIYQLEKDQYTIYFDKGEVERVIYTEPTSFLLDNSIEYDHNDIDMVYYNDAKGYHRVYKSEDDKGKPIIVNDIIIEKYTPKSLTQISSDDYSSIEIVMGKHHFTYDDDHWYITSVLDCILKDDAKDITHEEVKETDSFKYIEKEATFKIDDQIVNTAAFKEIVESEYNDYINYTITLDESGTIINFTTNHRISHY